MSKKSKSKQDSVDAGDHKPTWHRNTVAGLRWGILLFAVPFLIYYFVSDYIDGLFFSLFIGFPYILAVLIFALRNTGNRHRGTHSSSGGGGDGGDGG